MQTADRRVFPKEIRPAIKSFCNYARQNQASAGNAARLKIKIYVGKHLYQAETFLLKTRGIAAFFA